MTYGSYAGTGPKMRGKNRKPSILGITTNQELRELAKKTVAERAQCRTDKMYLANVLGYDFQECHQELFAVYPQYDNKKPWSEQSTKKDRMVLWPRGHYKSSSLVVEIIQIIINFPNIRLLVMQGSLSLTRAYFKQIKSHFLGEAQGSRLKELFPEFCGSKKELGPNPSTQFIVPCRTAKQLSQPTVMVASGKSIATGSHVDAGFFDDLVHSANYRNPQLLENVREDFTLAQSLIDPGGYRFVAGTRYAFGDMYEEILRWQNESQQWTVSVKDCWTDASADLPDAQKIPRFPEFRKKNGETGGFTRKKLLQMQTDDISHFSCQYLNRPLHHTQMVFTKELLYGAALSHTDAPNLSQPIFVCDLASTSSEHSDDNVIAVGKVDSMGIGYMVDLRGGVWSPQDMANNVIEMALQHRPTRILFEKSAAAVYFVDFIRLIAREKAVFLPLDFIKVNTQSDAKNMRVVALANVIRKGKFKFFLGLQNFDKLVDQACEFPKARHGHDDYPDTMALLYGELSKELMAQPIRPRPAGNPIFQLIEDRQTYMGKVLRERELAESDTELTGLE
jgi:hypothetical protein